MPVAGKSQKVDEGWAWVVVGGSFLNHFLFEGLVRSYGLIYLVLLDRFHGNAVSTAWIQATFNALAMATGPLAGVMVERYSCRIVVVSGGLLICAALVLSSFAPNLYFLYFSYSLVGGVGGGFVYSPMVVVVSQYFDKKRGKAMGLAALGGAVGTASVPPLVGFLLDTYGYAGCLVLVAAISLHHCISGLVYRPLTPRTGATDASEICSHQSIIGSTECLERFSRSTHPSRDRKLRNERLFSSVILLDQGKTDFETVSYSSLRALNLDTNGALPETKSLKRDGHPDRSFDGQVADRRELVAASDPRERTIAFRTNSDATERTTTNCPDIRRTFATGACRRMETLANVSFLLFCFNLFNIPSTLISTFIFLPGLAEEYSLSGYERDVLIAMIGTASGVGRIAFGFVFDLKRVRSRRRLLHSVLGVCLGISTGLLAVCRRFEALVAVCLCIGSSEGGVMAQRANALSQYVQADQLTFAFGILTMFQGFGNLIAPLLQGYLRDKLGSYRVCFCYGAGVTALSSGLLIVDYLVKSRRTLPVASDDGVTAARSLPK